MKHKTQETLEFLRGKPKVGKTTARINSQYSITDYKILQRGGLLPGLTTQKWEARCLQK